jgi:hypothetical protein
MGRGNHDVGQFRQRFRLLAFPDSDNAVVAEGPPELTQNAFGLGGISKTRD